MNAKAFDPAPAGFTFVIDTLYLYKNTLAAELRLATRCVQPRERAVR